MSLTSLLNDKSSTLFGFMAEQFPGMPDALAAYRARLPVGVDGVRPSPPAGIKPAWSTLGIAIDHRLRFALSGSREKSAAVARGVGEICVHYVRSKGAGHGLSSAIPAVYDRDGSPIDDHLVLGGYEKALAPFGFRIARALLRAGIALLHEIDDLLQSHVPSDRTRPMRLPDHAERRLDGVCFVAAWYEDTFRGGTVYSGTPLGDATETTTLDDLLASVPEYVLNDLDELVMLAEGGLGTIRASSRAEEIVAGPVFSGSRLVGGADADWIAGGLLCDVKSTTTPRRLEAKDVWQLLGYALLDTDDHYGIEQVGWYLSRLGQLISWDLPELLMLLQARGNIDDLRLRLSKQLES